MERKTVVCLGDSLTNGRVSANYVEMLARRLEGFSFINAGVNKELSYNVLQRVAHCIESEPGAVTVLVGTNDANASLDDAYARRAMKNLNLPRQPTPSWFQQNLKELVDQLQSGTDAKIALLSIPPIGEDLTHRSVQRAGEYSEIIREVAVRAGVGYLPLHETMINDLAQNPSSPRNPYDRWRYVVYKGLFQRKVLRMTLDGISEANGFHLLTDFIHLNTRGAGMVADCIHAFLLDA